MTKSKKGKKRGTQDQPEASGSQQQQQQQPSASQQQQQQPSRPQQQQTQQGPQQQQQPHGPQQHQVRGSQQQLPSGPQQQEPRGPQQQQPRGPQQQQPRGPQQQQQQGQRGAWQQQQQPGPQQQQQPGPQQQQQPGPQQHQQQPRGPQHQQQPRGPQHQQVPGQQQQQPRGPQQQQPRGPQQQEPRGPQQQQPRGPQQQQQQGQRGAWQQQQQPGPQQQQQPGPQQQQQPGPQQHQQQPRGPQHQQQPRGPQHQQVPGQQQQQPRGPQQQQPRGPQQQEPRGPQQQQPRGPQQQQQQGQRGAWQQQQQPGPQQQQQGKRGPWQQQQTLSGPQQQPSGSDQQQQPPSEPLQQPQQPKLEPKPRTEELQIQRLQEETTTLSLRGRNGRSTLPSALQKMYIEQIPKRSSQGGGKAGRPIYVETNMLRINFNSKFLKDVIHYDVVIEPDRPKFLMRPIFEEYRKMFFPQRYPAFDGRKNAYSAKDLPFGDHSKESEVKVFDPERQMERTFKVYMKKAAVLDLSWLMNISYGTVEYQREDKGLQALDIILRHGPASRYTTVGRSLFQEPEPGRVVSLTNGVQLWVGVFQSAVVGWRPYLNIDIAHKGFPTCQSVIDLMRELCADPRSRGQQQSLHPNDVRSNADKITKFLKGLKVQYEIPGQSNTKRTYRVNGLAECARKDRFQTETGEYTVEDYFAQVKRYRLQFPELPCLWVGSRTNEKKIHLPVELCTIVAGQVTQRKLDPDQTAKMIREAATDTHRRKAKIMEGFAKMNLNAQPTLLNEFHLSVQGEFEKVPARVLQAPKLLYHNREVNVMKGVWRANEFLNVCDLPANSWTILNLDKYTRDCDLYTLHDKLMDGGRSVRMTIGKGITPFTALSVQPRDVNNVIKYFQEKKELGLKLVVVIIPNLDNAYSLVKQISELRTTGGLVTQCLKSQTLRKLSDATITNILLKINSKLNGINHSFALTHKPPCLKVPCMLIGADVTHPSPDATDIPSIAAVAASHDPKAFQYNIELRLQSPREEMIQDLEEIMRKQLIFFYKKTGYKPSKIIFYRDGVSEGQLPQVMHFELSAIKKAIARLEKSTEHSIPITFLVVQKRHHIRLFPTDTRNSDDRNYNVQAGTIVDTEITHPTHIDFYLVSHASIQGTARPTKYRCICNENKMSEDEIEQLTYYLCHMFARCTRSVSYPAPTYYAHLAAFRARAWIHNVPLNIDNLPEEQRRKMNMQMENSPMFFV